MLCAGSARGFVPARVCSGHCELSPLSWGRSETQSPFKGLTPHREGEGESGLGSYPPAMLTLPKAQTDVSASEKVLSHKAGEVLNCVPPNAGFYLAGTCLGAVLFFSLTQFHYMQLKGSFAKGARVLSGSAGPLESRAGFTPHAPLVEP